MASTLALLLSLAMPLWSAPAGATDESAAEVAQLDARLAAIDAHPLLADKAQLERWKARQSVAAVATGKSRDREHLLYVARARVAAAERAAQAELLMQQSAQLDRERAQIMVEASRLQAAAAQREADRLRREAMAREEETQRIAEAAAQERAELVQDSAHADAAAAQAMKLAEARAEETRLARKEAELASALAADSAGPAAATPPPARAMGKATVYTLPGTAFASGSATLAPSAIASLRGLFKSIGANKKLRVEAHTDDQGSDSVNLALSQRRADAVRKALSDTGIAPSRITAVGKGEAAPVADNGTAEGRARNRRVEIIVQ
jgi:outer membrane protein OmpA-like peptidoglycan-associated protein